MILILLFGGTVLVFQNEMLIKLEADCAVLVLIVCRNSVHIKLFFSKFHWAIAEKAANTIDHGCGKNLFSADCFFVLMGCVNLYIVCSFSADE